MGLKEILEKLKGNEEEVREEPPDDVTRDRHLRSLRRQMRVLNEEEEKVFLKKKIAAIQKAKLAKHMFGIKSDQVQKIVKAKKIKKARSILTNHGSFFGRNHI